MQLLVIINRKVRWTLIVGDAAAGDHKQEGEVDTKLDTKLDKSIFITQKSLLKNH
jgi:hypothetical protein